MTILEIFLPFVAFILGWFFNITYNKYMSKQKVIQESIKALWEKSRDWYHQVYEISQNYQVNLSHNILSKDIQKYFDTREILPEYLYHLEIIKGYKKYKELYNECMKFLSYLTIKGERFKEGRYTDCAFPYQNAYSVSKLLVDLDTTLQDIAKLCGKFAKK